MNARTAISTMFSICKVTNKFIAFDVLKLRQQRRIWRRERYPIDQRLNMVSVRSNCAKEKLCSFRYSPLCNFVIFSIFYF